MAPIEPGKPEAVLLVAKSRLAAAADNSALRNDPLQDVVRAQESVVDVARELVLMMRATMDGQRPKLTERELAELTTIAGMAADQVIAQRDRRRVRYMAALFGTLALIGMAGAGLAGYSARSDRCETLESWAASISRR